jgi:hypothetical protein
VAPFLQIQTPFKYKSKPAANSAFWPLAVRYWLYILFNLVLWFNKKHLQNFLWKTNVQFTIRQGQKLKANGQ